MSDRKVTSVVYADSYSLTVDGERKTFDIVNEFGGGVYSSHDNIIVVAPSIKRIIVPREPMQNADGIFLEPISFEDVLQNTTSALFHEIGERNTPSRVDYRYVVIDYENHVRRIMGMPRRPYDLNGHSKYTPTIYGRTGHLDN